MRAAPLAKKFNCLRVGVQRNPPRAQSAAAEALSVRRAPTAAAATAAVSFDGISVHDGVPTVRSSIAISNSAQKKTVYNKHSARELSSERSYIF